MQRALERITPIFLKQGQTGSQKYRNIPQRVEISVMFEHGNAWVFSEGMSKDKTSGKQKDNEFSHKCDKQNQNPADYAFITSI